MQEEYFEIFQMKKEKDMIGFLFMGYDFWTKEGKQVTGDLYESVYRAPLKTGMNLEKIYHIFNLEHPEDFKGHSLSISDVVVLYEQGETKAFFVDAAGFTEVPEFFSKNMEQKKTSEEQPDGISFYVAECSEFPSLGEYHENLTLEEAVEIFKRIPPERRNGLPAIGFKLEPDRLYYGEFDLYCGGEIVEEIKNIDEFYQNPLVRKAISDIQKMSEEGKLDRQNEDRHKKKIRKAGR